MLAVSPGLAGYSFTADSLEVDRPGGRALLEGSVRLRSETEILTADRMEIFFEESLEDVIRVVASGRVSLQRDETGDSWVATAEQADYYPRSDTALLTGEVVLRQGRNDLRGERALYDGGYGTLKLEGDVRGKIHPEAGVQKDDD